MSIPTASEQLLLDTHPQRTDLYLSIYEPEIAMICQVTGSYDQANQRVNYYNVITGSADNVGTRWFQVALIGTAPYLEDVGRTWVRAVSDERVRFVESDHINWQNNLYITILKYTEIIPVFPRIIQNPSNEEDVIFYKIWDIAYTNQNSILGTFVNMGSNYAGFLSNGTGTCYWSASGSSNLLGDNLTYSWTFEGAVITGSTAHTPGYVAYNQPGHHRTILQVTSDSGRVDTSFRYVSWYDRPGEGDNVPILNWEFSEPPSGSRESLGWACRLKIREDVARTKLRDNALVVIFGEDWYNTTKQSVNNSQLGRASIKFVGYVDAGTIQYNYADGWVEFEAISPTKFMELCECFSCSVESKTSPSAWYELLDMDIRRAVYHYLAWQSSVLMVCDVEFKNFVDRYIQYFDADRTSLYDAINTVVSGARGGKVVSDRLGKIWIEQEPDVLNSGTSQLPVALSFTKKDWIGEPIIDERQLQEVSFIEMGGISYDPATNTFSALLADAPGTSPGYRGKVERTQGWALLDQDELNTIIGNKFAYMNSRYPSIELDLRGNYNNIDIAPQEQYRLTIAQGDTPRNIVFSNKGFVQRNLVMQWDARTKTIITKLSLAELTQGFAGDTVIIPDEPPDEGDDNAGGTYKQPPIQVPPIPTPVSPIGLQLYDEGNYLGLISALNFVGTPVTATISGATGTATITGGVQIYAVLKADIMYDATNSWALEEMIWNSGYDPFGILTTGSANHLITGEGTFLAMAIGEISYYTPDTLPIDTEEANLFALLGRIRVQQNAGVYEEQNVAARIGKLSANWVGGATCASGCWGASLSATAVKVFNMDSNDYIKVETGCYLTSGYGEDANYRAEAWLILVKIG